MLTNVCACKEVVPRQLCRGLDAHAAGSPPQRGPEGVQRGVGIPSVLASEMMSFMAARFWCRFLSVHGIRSLPHRLLVPANFGHGNVFTRSSDTAKTWTALSDLHLGRRCSRHALCTLHVVQLQKHICQSSSSTLLQNECPVQVARGHCPVHMLFHDVFVLCT